jgi:Cys-tRNA(Pro)/Cys-tRNA(Cys) deacylase
VRALEAAGVSFSLHPYEHDPAADSYGEEAADIAV